MTLADNLSSTARLSHLISSRLIPSKSDCRRWGNLDGLFFRVFLRLDVGCMFSADVWRLKQQFQRFFRALHDHSHTIPEVGDVDKMLHHARRTKLDFAKVLRWK